MKHIVMTTPIQVTDAQGNKSDAPGQTTWRPSNDAQVQGQYRKLLNQQKRGLLDPSLTPAQVMALALQQTPPAPPHYHLIGDYNGDTTGAEYVGEWDGVAPYVTVLVGNLYERTLAPMGWPMIDQPTWQAENPV